METPSEQIQKAVDPNKTLNVSGLEEFVRCMKSPWRIIWSNFLAGFFRSFGWVVGCIITISLISWVLAQFVDFSFFHSFMAEVSQIVDKISKLPNLVR